MPDATFARPDLTTFARLDELGLEVVGQRLEPDRAVLACRVAEPDEWCRRCGCEGASFDTVVRRLAHEPLGWPTTTLEVTIRRYRCTGCGHVWRGAVTDTMNLLKCGSVRRLPLGPASRASRFFGAALLAGADLRGALVA